MLFGVKSLKWLYFEWSAIEKSKDWLTFLNESFFVSSVHDGAGGGCFLAIVLSELPKPTFFLVKK